MKTIESNICPVKGDIIDYLGFHNGYEVGEITLNSAECLVPLPPTCV